MAGSLFVVSAPSGAGKTSLVNALVEQYKNVSLSVSHTTRQAREGEVDGEDYYFVTQTQFAQLCETGAFLESAKVFDNSYGTSSEIVLSQLQAGIDVILEIDWQGAQQVRKNHPDCTSIFILPPSRSTLEQRLRGRGQDNDEIIARRMHDAENEMSHYVEFDHLIVNDDFSEALSDLVAVITAQRLSLGIQKKVQADLLVELLA
ncbi:MAG: guanylate kinase [Gammaproteobacteria bacterium]|nr:MAG: guanylate kinase [Gammaproteobacteria bacterium]